MNRKQIEQKLRAKMDSYLKSIPEEIRGVVRNNLIVTGGSIVSMLLDEPVNDYDIYIESPSVLLKLMLHYARQCKVEVIMIPEGEQRVVFFNGKPEERQKTLKERIVIDPNIEIPKNARFCFLIKSAGMKKFRNKEKYKPVCVTDNAISLRGDIQLIVRFYGNHDQIHENFDFAHTKAYWTYATGLVIPEGVAEAILSKELVYKGSKYPIASLIRTRKFVQRKWSISAGEYVKMALQVSKLNLEDVNVLYDQLVGVDIAYFNNFLEAIEKDRKEGKVERIDGQYLIEKIDEVFSKYPEEEEDQEESE